jgi:hypothetical protein
MEREVFEGGPYLGVGGLIHVLSILLLIHMKRLFRDSLCLLRDFMRPIYSLCFIINNP